MGADVLHGYLLEWGLELVVDGVVDLVVRSVEDYAVFGAHMITNALNNNFTSL